MVQNSRILLLHTTKDGQRWWTTDVEVNLSQRWLGKKVKLLGLDKATGHANKPQKLAQKTNFQNVDNFLPRLKVEPLGLAEPGGRLTLSIDLYESVGNIITTLYVNLN